MSIIGRGPYLKHPYDIVCVEVDGDWSFLRSGFGARMG
jgi:hypothetical protein